MKKIYVSALLVASVLLLVRCSPKVANLVTSGPVPSPEEVKTSFTSTQLEEGKTVWESTCKRCHKLFPPESHNPDEWNRILRRMIPRARLELEEAKLVHAYLIAHAANPE